MFGIGFTELMLISIIAILFLGPDKLPGALVEMGKFIKSVKKTIGDAKSSLEEEMQISDLKEEALSYKKQLTDATDELKGFKNLSLDDDFDDDETYGEEPEKKSPSKILKKSKDAYATAPTKTQTPPDDKESESATTQVEAKNETVTLKKKPKKEKVIKKDKPLKEKKLAKKETENSQETENKKGDA